MAYKGDIKQGHVISHVTVGGFQQVCDIVNLEIINFLQHFFFKLIFLYILKVVVLIT